MQNSVAVQNCGDIQNHLDLMCSRQSVRISSYCQNTQSDKGFVVFNLFKTHLSRCTFYASGLCSKINTKAFFHNEQNIYMERVCFQFCTNLSIQFLNRRYQRSTVYLMNYWAHDRHNCLINPDRLHNRIGAIQSPALQWGTAVRQPSLSNRQLFRSLEEEAQRLCN